jgi:hypothetical protein
MVLEIPVCDPLDFRGVSYLYGLFALHEIFDRCRSSIPVSIYWRVHQELNPFPFR